MFKKIKNFIRDKLRDFLGVNYLSMEMNKVECRLIEKLRKETDNRKNDMKHLQESVSVLHNTIENVVHIGTDLRYPQDSCHSWAVVCIEGKMNLVKFVDLGRSDARHVLDFLKQFEAGRHCIDSPSHRMFYDGLFKF